MIELSLTNAAASIVGLMGDYFLTSTQMAWITPGTQKNIVSKRFSQNWMPIPTLRKTDNGGKRKAKIIRMISN